MTDTLAVSDQEFLEFVIDPSKRVDPYPFFARLREAHPVHKVGAIGVWVLSSYDDVNHVLRDPLCSTDEHHHAGFSEEFENAMPTFSRMFQSMMLFQDDPAHKRLRDLVQKAFTRKMVEGLRPRIERLVDGLTEELLERGTGDLITDYAYPLPVTVICELLGVPEEDRDSFHDWAPDIAKMFEVQPMRTREHEAIGERATVRLVAYLDELIEAKRRNPCDDLLSSLVQVEDAGDRLTHDELLGTCILILFAGHETTANLIGNGVHALMQHRAQWARLVDDPSLARSAVEEVLRFDTPVQIVQRITTADVALPSATIPKGEAIGIMFGAANRDPARYEDPDVLDITRDEAPLVAFGGGIHFCLGAPLARLEAQISLASLARRVPGLRLDAEPQRRPSFLIRGFQTLPVATA